MGVPVKIALKGQAVASSVLPGCVEPAMKQADKTLQKAAALREEKHD